MHVTMVMVSSINGKITRDNETSIYGWTSEEDQELFSKMIQEHNLMVMGGKTYEAAKEIIKLSPKILRIVLTQHPEKYTAVGVPDQLEFRNEDPSELINELEKKGFKKMMLVGGGEINSLFLQKNLVNEVCLTIEPHIFGKGKSVVAEQSHLAISLQLISSERLNAKGTLFLRYRVV